MNQDKVMLLIDADNVSIDVIEQAVAWVGRHFGGPHVRRAYCTAESAVKHQGAFKRLGIRPMVNLAAGKNSTDIALAVDAIDLAVAERPDVMVIASSDSDFAPLVGRLREKGCKVVGVGQRGKTGDETRMVYDDFEVMDHRKGPARLSNSRRAGSSPAVAVPMPSSDQVSLGRVKTAAPPSPPVTPPDAAPAPAPAPEAAHAATPAAKSRRGRGRSKVTSPSLSASADGQHEAAGPAVGATGGSAGGSAGGAPQAKAKPASQRTRTRKPAASSQPTSAPQPAETADSTPRTDAIAPPASAESGGSEARRPRRRRSGRSRGPKAEGGAPAAD
jgi:hypothetical protein